MLRLTHLCFTAVGFLSRFPPLLKSSCFPRPSLDLKNPAFVGLLSDLLFAVITYFWYLMDSQKVAHVGASYWTRADDFIAKRRSSDSNAKDYPLTM
ncbi:hypothetical protein B0H19DRAFT_1262417 [Mycena capillaripes]|nr:hypothetical protein B0H19DRAFT_1262417 [Mycena capillaripes]